ncbi:hypothetical protein [Sedimenticola selenatireducens]|uniref:hypothetical protein n=1 Tax=Sedimenticola selenatireducens TaxID=191960 RepID=UPI002AAC1230|nr:hypothetical protein [Sedimenticola selenatireducens]
MKHDPKTYGILLTVFLLSLGAAWIIPAKDVLKAVVASPGVVALLSALFQLLRDQAAHEKQLEIQNNQSKFTLGAASHMANTAFDKHVEFCEKYMAEIHASVSTLFRKGNTPEALTHAENLHELRLEYAVWLTDAINEKLQIFEKAIRKLGADSQFIRSTTDSPNHAEQRTIVIQRSHDLFLEILGIDESKEVNEEYAVEAVKKKVRAILGVEELTRLREHLVIEASKAIERST